MIPKPKGMRERMLASVCMAVFPGLAWLPAPAQTKPAPGLYDHGVLRTLSLSFVQKDWWDQLVKNKPGEIYIPADLVLDGKVYPRVGVRLRGQSSYQHAMSMNSRKVPFRIALDHYVEGQEFQGYDTILLNNGYGDPTFMREVVAMRMLGEVLPVPKANFVVLEINGENWGVYVNLQALDKAFLRESWANAEGNRYKGVGNFGYLGPTPLFYQYSMPLKSEPRQNSYHDLIRALSSLAVSPVSQRIVEIPKVIDLDMALRHLAGTMVLNNTDGLPRMNYYLYVDPYHDQLAIIPWDVDTGFWFSLGYTNQQPMLFKDSLLWERRYHAHVRSMTEQFLDWPVIGGWVQQYGQLIDAEVMRDNKKLYSYAAYQNNLTQPYALFPHVTIEGLRPVVEQRRKLLLSLPFLSGPRPSLSQPGHSLENPTYKQTVAVTVKAQVQPPASMGGVTLHYRSRGYFNELALFDDGKHGDGAAGDGVYGNAIPAQPAGSLVEYYFSAETDAASGSMVSFLPFNTALRPYGYRVQPRRDSILIHEFLARNDKGIRNEHGNRNDWVELFNPTPSGLGLDGMFLTDNLAEPKRWAFPLGIRIPAGGALLVWADAEIDENTEGYGLHASFALAGEGEELALLDKDGRTVLDWLAFGPQEKDISTGRVQDRLSPFVTYAQPTPGRGNELSPCGARRWSALQPASHTMQLDVAGYPKPGNALQFLVAGAAPNATWLLLTSDQPDNVEIPALGISLLLSLPPKAFHVLPTDGLGKGSLPVLLPNNPALAGLRFSFQAFSSGTSSYLASNGLEIGVCKN